MRETDRIRQQMEQAFLGEAWHGPSVREMLRDVDARCAASRPIRGMHTIWEIVLHLASTQQILLDRLRGVSRELTPEEDWPPVGVVTESAWREAVARLENADEQLRTQVAEFPVERLDGPLVEGGSSAYNNFHGYIQHNLYHLAQIGVLKRAGTTGAVS